MYIGTKNDFTEFANKFWDTRKKPFAFAIGKKIFDVDGEHITTKFLAINREENYGTLAAILDDCMQQITPMSSNIAEIEISRKRLLAKYFKPFMMESGHDNLNALLSIGGDENVCSIIVYPTKHSLKTPAINHVDAMCRLTMVSAGKIQKHGDVSFEGVFGKLNNLYYTNNDAYTSKDWAQHILSNNVESLVAADKFPPMCWATPFLENVRVPNPSMIRLGAYLGPGTVVMHAGFVNFNTWIEGPAMIEGRVSAGVYIGKNTDIGGGASIMGTLSGGGKEVIFIGNNCLVGANAGTGISLGNRCTIEAGTYVTAAKKVTVCSAKFANLTENQQIKAVDLSGRSDMLFLTNSTNGVLELRWNKNPVHLNKDLH